MDVDSTRTARRTGWLVAALVIASTFIGSSARAQETDLDALMARVLERRNETWKALHDYVLDERERFALVGPSDVRLFGQDREYTWYVRDGMLVRSPVKANGVTVPDADRREYERRWVAQEEARAERARRKADTTKDQGPITKGQEPKAKDQEPKTKDQESRTKDQETTSTVETPTGDVTGADAPAAVVAKGLEPRFVSEANFLRFRFETGRYFLVGREVLDGRPVLKIEYYPTKLFAGDERDEGRRDEQRRKEGRSDDARRDAGQAREQEFERQFNKVSMVTLWVDPAESQIVRYDFENLGLDFIPGQWLVRVGETSASMTMGRYFDGVWLPRAIVLKGDLQVAIGAFDIEYRREFLEYRKAETSARIRGYGDVK